MRVPIGVFLAGFCFSPCLLAGSLENPFAARPVQVRRQDLTRTLVLAATVKPLWQTDVTAPADGWIRAVSADIGKRVRRDGALATLAAAGKPGAPPARPIKVEAPFEGVVIARMASIGAFVRQGEVLFTCLDDEKMRARAFVQEKDSVLLREGAKVFLQPEHFPGLTYEGQLTSIVPRIDPVTHMREVESILPNADRRLVAGMVGQLSVTVDIRHDVLVVPREALLLQKNETYVFAVREGRARRVRITVGSENKTGVEAREGLAEGDWILVNPQLVREGTAIAPN